VCEAGDSLTPVIVFSPDPSPVVQISAEKRKEIHLLKIQKTCNTQDGALRLTIHVTYKGVLYIRSSASTGYS
jgi:hypothetical protein